MGRFQNFMRKVLGVDKMIDETISQRLGTVNYIETGQEELLEASMLYDLDEFQTWVTNDADKILYFYKNKKRPSQIISRSLYWQEIGNLEQYPKMHYPAASMVTNQMNSLTFSEELDINIKIPIDNKQKDVSEEDQKKAIEKDIEETDRLLEILDANEFYELCQKSSFLETYSGTLGWKPLIDDEVSEHPFVIPYPAEQIRFKTKLGKVLEIIYLDYFVKDKKYYVLKSHYGKGYITYTLWDEKMKNELPLETINELKDLKSIVINYEGKPLNMLLSTYKKNRSFSNKYANTPYGGSDFEGIIDSFHSIDRTYSDKELYKRRTRPMQSMTDKFLKTDPKTGLRILPKEWEMDTIITNALIDPNATDKGASGYNRDIPDFNTSGYNQEIIDELKTIWRTIGMAYTTVGLEAHSANISGAALELKEKSSVIIRSHKIKLWKQFLRDSFRLLLILDSLKDIKPTLDEDEKLIYNITDTFDYDYQVEFPSYNNQTFMDKLEEATKSLTVLDTETILERLLIGEYSQEEIDEIVLRKKAEASIPIFPNQVQKTQPPKEKVEEDANLTS